MTKVNLLLKNNEESRRVIFLLTEKIKRNDVKKDGVHLEVELLGVNKQELIIILDLCFDSTHIIAYNIEGRQT